MQIGGHAYQISVRRRIAFDRRHALSGRACAVCVEIGVIVFCLLVVGLMVRDSAEIARDARVVWPN